MGQLSTLNLSVSTNVKRNIKVFQLHLKCNIRMRRDEHKWNNEFEIVKWVVDLEIYIICQMVQTGYDESFLHGVDALYQAQLYTVLDV